MQNSYALDARRYEEGGELPGHPALVVDNLRVRHAKVVTDWLADKTDRVELACPPPHNPEANRDEYLNHDFKTALRLGHVSHNLESLLEKAVAFMTRLTTWLERVRAYFQHPAARYAPSAIFGPVNKGISKQKPPLTSSGYYVHLWYKSIGQTYRKVGTESRGS